MRIHLQLYVTGKSKEEIETKLKERLANYLNVEIEEVEEKVDIEMHVSVGEEGPMQLTFGADCRIKVKN